MNLKYLALEIVHEKYMTTESLFTWQMFQNTRLVDVGAASKLAK